MQNLSDNTLHISPLRKWGAELVCLMLLIISLPSFEAPKNIFFTLYLVLWLTNRIRKHDFGGPWNTWDTLIVLWIGIAYMGTLFAGVPTSINSNNDLLRYSLLFWAIKRSGYRSEEIILILLAIIFSTILAIAIGLVQVFGFHQSLNWAQLNSVGQINHSAIYLAIVFGCALAVTVSYWKDLTLDKRVAFSFITAFLALTVIQAESRAAVGMSALFIIMMGLVYLSRSRWILRTLILLLIGVTAFSIVGEVSIVKKQNAYIATNDMLSQRDKIWNNAIGAWQMYPWFGVGANNFSKIEKEAILKWKRQANIKYEETDYYYRSTSHAHNLYLNVLAERGGVGFILLMAFLVYWAMQLFVHRPKTADSNCTWALWGGSLSAFVMVVGIGLVNTTLHHEHAMLSVIVLAMWLAGLQQYKTNQAYNSRETT